MASKSTITKTLLLLAAAAVLVAVLAASNAPVASAQGPDPCNQVKTEKTCNSDANCVWCKCRAIPSGCFSLARALCAACGVAITIARRVP